jgi:tyrosyl-DNA phosphodiesterase-1
VVSCPLLSAEWHYARAIALSLRGSARPPSITPASCKDYEDDEEARFQNDLARAIAASKANASPATSIASLSSDQSQTGDVGTEPTCASAVATTHSSPSFLAERAQLERQRLARLKRLRGSTDSHITGPPSKRRASPRETNCTPVAEAGPSRGENETVGQEAEVFWNGELRQTANMHVEPGRNGTDGKPVFRLSEIIGDVRLFRYLLTFADGKGSRKRR